MRLRLFIAILFLVCWLLIPATAQNIQPTPEPVQITEREKVEIQKFTKKFIAQLTRNRDVRPLIKDWFPKDFDTFIYHYLIEDEETIKVTPLSPRNRKRLVISTLNLMTVIAPYTVSGPDFEKQMPPRVARIYERVMTLYENDCSNDFFLVSPRCMIPVESANRKIAAYLRKHPVELTKTFRDALRKRENLDDYNYSIVEDVPQREDDNPSAKWIRNHSNGKTYLVGTPVGLGIGIIRIDGKYKVLYLMHWPISYDSRL